LGQGGVFSGDQKERSKRRALEKKDRNYPQCGQSTITRERAVRVFIRVKKPVREMQQRGERAPKCRWERLRQPVKGEELFKRGRESSQEVGERRPLHFVNL